MDEKKTLLVPCLIMKSNEIKKIRFVCHQKKIVYDAMIMDCSNSIKK